jgi:hypothetical protein
MKRIAAVFLLFVFMLFSSYAQTSGTAKPEPYGKTEFPKWQQDLRRAEIIAFGTLPFVTFLSSVGFEIYRYRENNFADPYKPWPIKDNKTAIPLTEKEQVSIFMISVGISIASTIFDYGYRAIMREIRANAMDRHNSEIPDPIQIEPISAAAVSEPAPQSEGSTD